MSNKEVKLAKPKGWADLRAGLISGFLCGVLYQPLDVIKVNMIVLPGSFHYRKRSAYENLRDLSSHIYKREGIRGFFRGTTVSVVRASLSAGMYFWLMRQLDALSDNDRHSKTKNFLTSAVARCITGFTLNPLGIIRTRCQLIDDGEYSQLRNAVRALIKTEGYNAFFKGGLSMMLEEFPFGGVYNLTYEFINERWEFREKRSKAGLALSGVVAGVVAGTLTHPAELVRTKIQSHKVDWSRRVNNSIILSILVDAYEKYGVAGLFKGLQPRLIKKTLVSASTFFFYEVFIRANRQLKN